MEVMRDATRENLSLRDREELGHPAVIIHIGAGDCGELGSYMALQPKRVVLVEADPKRAKGLSRRIAGMSGVEVLPLAIDADKGRKSFRVFNLPDWNSLRAPDGLKRLFPGLRLLREMEVETVSVLDLMERIGLDAGEDNWLVVDAPGSEAAIVETLCEAGQLDCFGSIVLHCGRDSLYEGSASAEEILGFLRQHGYKSVSPSSGSDPDLVCRVLRLSPLNAECAALQERIDELLAERGEQSSLIEELRGKLQNLSRDYEQVKRRLTDDHANLERVSRELDIHVRQVSELGRALESAGRDRDELARDYRARISELERTSHEREVEVSILRAENERVSRDRDEKERVVGELRQQLGHALAGYEERGNRLWEQQTILDGINAAHSEQARLTGERSNLLQHLLEKADQNMAELLEVVRRYENRFNDIEKGIRKDLVRSILNSTRQLESRISIESYLSRGYVIPEMGGWAASADIALFLIKLIESKNYDLIIEFGSGTSTVLMASVLYGQVRRGLSITHSDRNGVRELSVNEKREGDHQSGALSSRQGSFAKTADLMPRIVTFEHQRKYFDETNENLLQAGVSELVEMNHAPLRDYSAAHGEHFLYYTCEERIAELAVLLRGRKARILVFVDGPPGSTGKHARYPALPILLQYFSGHELDILLDDYNREDERGIAKRWEDMLSERSLSWQKEILGFEKGAIFLSVS